VKLERADGHLQQSEERTRTCSKIFQGTPETTEESRREIVAKFIDDDHGKLTKATPGECSGRGKPGSRWKNAKAVKAGGGKHKKGDRQSSLMGLNGTLIDLRRNEY